MSKFKEIKTENKLLIISIFIIICITLCSIVNYIKWYNNHVDAIEQTITECKNNNIEERNSVIIY